MEKIWAPWRMQYILADKKDGCIFCDKVREGEDRKNYILFRDRLGFIIMNIFPYNNGHLMIAPYRHAASLEDLTSEELLQIMTLTKKSLSCLQQAMKAEGYNIGMNIGAVAGAGIADHLHLHIVPRWSGDTNFMPVLADTKVLPQHLDTTYDLLKPLFR